MLCFDLFVKGDYGQRENNLVNFSDPFSIIIFGKSGVIITQVLTRFEIKNEWFRIRKRH